MRANRRVSGAETKFRRALWAAGARGYRRGDSLPGRPDVVFPAVRLAVFVNGCYWHRCPACSLRPVKANADFWQSKFETNVARDERVQASLAEAGWRVLVVWEHEIRQDLAAVSNKAAATVADLREAT